MRSSPDERFLTRLAAALRNLHLDAIVVGNVASILNGAPVQTQDVDLLVRSTPRNEHKLRQLAKALGGVGPEDFAWRVPAKRIYGTEVPIDIYDRLIGVTFAAVQAHAAPVPIGTEILIVASLADVIKSKAAAGRPKDKAVLPVLRETLAARQGRAK